MNDGVKYEYINDGYGLITLNRPLKRNAISEDMMSKLYESILKAKNDPIKFLVITGAGDKMFCAGGDLTELHGELSNSDAFNVLDKMKEVLYQIAIFPVPTICLLNGNALGGGCEIATSCDFRIAKTSTRFGFVQANLGILPGWGGGALLYEKVNPTFAYQWLLEANIYDANYLMEQGWINQIISSEEWGDVHNLVQPYLNRSTEQMKLLKGQYLASISVESLYRKMSDEVKSCASLWESPEHKLAVQRFSNR
ncbi:enoyl-CoA hydratase/isomerase family protein [Ornithinibacillus halophilus]|uniref:Enoyl-CoA hydratase/carnithine racemase n=1 Tax=Ornithinibacillus halophilus TaxID=930117 RepID=A0A1M5C357_9BACI|nr:enoyl-CoA hydratase/isomerase family protein [Ornithinibacillus halophilus]SHF49198.1 Enoyl-CoA hydratase/carnithine racemase [Ornithinibacillus halophilus]